MVTAKRESILAANVLEAKAYRQFCTELREYEDLCNQEKTIDKVKKKVRSNIEQFIQDIGEDFIDAGDYHISYVAGKMPDKLDGNLIYTELLNIMSANEADAILARCNVPGGMKAPSLRVTRREE